MKTNIKNIIIDSEFEKLLPKLSKEEFNGLSKDIELRGAIDPLIIWLTNDDKEILIDGHNRLRIIKEKGLDFDVNYQYFETRTDAKIWILKNQLNRRNLTDFHRTELGLKLKPLYADQAKESQKRKPESVSLNSNKQNTLQKIADESDVSRDTVYKVDKIVQKASDRVKDQLRSGDISIHKAYTDLQEPKEGTPKACFLCGNMDCSFISIKYRDFKASGYICDNCAAPIKTIWECIV